MVVNNLIGASVVILWRKLEPWAVALRTELGAPSAFEWFQWLAERLADVGDLDSDPAYIAHKGWMPSHLRQEI
jgi:hypothetical protein